MNKSQLTTAIIKGNIEWRKHALQMMFKRNISRENVKEVVMKGEIIETYKGDKPFPSALFFNKVKNRPIHVVVAFEETQDKLYIITAYEPTLDIFESDFKTRKKK